MTAGSAEIAAGADFLESGVIAFEFNEWLALLDFVLAIFKGGAGNVVFRLVRHAPHLTRALYVARRCSAVEPESRHNSLDILSLST